MRKKYSIMKAAALAAVALCGAAASAAPLTVSSTVDQSGYVGSQDQPTYPLTAIAYDYTGQQFANFSTLTSISVTLSVLDGDTASGQFAEGFLTLGLDGIDTGLVLDGFASPGVATLNFTGNPNLAASILAALKADGQLIGTVIDHTPPGNVPAGGDFIGFSSLSQTTLDITGDAQVNGGTGGGGGPQGVPLPAAICLAPIGAGIASAFSRRIRKTK